jgi:hypothetical protein
MKAAKIFLFVLIIISLFCGKLVAQDLNVHYMIGKKVADVLKKYGTPVHQDQSNPAMVCVFYKVNDASMTFVGDNNGIYQTEANKSYVSGREARFDVDNFISKSISNRFVCDTLSINEFELSKAGVKVSLNISENKLTKKIDVYVKAKDSEG